MAVVRIVELGHGRRRGEWGYFAQTRHVRKWRVYTDDVEDTSATVLLAFSGSDDGVSFGDPFPDDEDATVTKLTADETDDPQKWEVEAEYTAEPDPLTLPAEVKESTEKVQKVRERDIDGLLIGSTASEPFEPASEFPRRRLVIEVTKNLPVVEAENISSNYLDRVNLTEFMGYAVGTVLLDEYGADVVQRRGFPDYKRARFKFVIDPEGWLYRPLDQGTYYWVAGVPPTRRMFVEPATGRPLTNPQPLDGAGAALATNGTPVYLEFRVHDNAEFNALGLGV